MLLLSAVLALTMQTAPASHVELVIPAGACRVVLDGKPLSMDALAPALEAWGRSNPEVELRADPEASYECFDWVLRVLKAVKVPMQLGFVGNEAIATEHRK